jgi:hypothetical protein
MSTVLIQDKKKELFKSRRMSRKKSNQNLRKKLQLEHEANLQTSIDP